MAHNSKQLGAAWEARFTADALKRGLNVLQPIGDYLPYDLMVENKRDDTYRVQVKGTSYRQTGKKDIYRISAVSGNSKIGKRAITKEQVDVLAIFVVPLTTWYHIPIEKITASAVYVRPVEGSSAQYEVWKEAWNTYF